MRPDLRVFIEGRRLIFHLHGQGYDTQVDVHRNYLDVDERSFDDNLDPFYTDAAYKTSAREDTGPVVFEWVELKVLSDLEKDYQRAVHYQFLGVTAEFTWEEFTAFLQGGSNDSTETPKDQ